MVRYGVPIPSLIVDRELELGRDATPADFTEPERQEILMLLPRCLRAAHVSLKRFAAASAQLTVKSTPVRNEALRAAEWVGVLEDAYEAFSNAAATDAEGVTAS